jgi:cyclopropane fatty-acyl-phospholipid synthase-like methyltransferase
VDVSAEVGAAWREQELVSSYLDRRQILLPMIDVQEELIERLISRHERPIAHVLDLGCGDGAMAELVLRSAPAAEAVLVDFSEPMLARVAERLDRTVAGRWQAVRGDLREAAWTGALPAGPYDAIVSGMAIHHLPAERKRELYGEVFALLAPGGLFVNMDYVAVEGPLEGLFDEEMHAKAAAHGRHEHPEGEDAVVDDLDSDDDQPDSVLRQLQWLREAGFTAAEVHFKWAEAAVFGALRP